MASPRDVPGMAMAAVAVGLGVAAALRRRREVREERAGLLERLGPDGPGHEPPGRVDRTVANWHPTAPGTRAQQAMVTAWTAPATVVGLLLARVGRGTVTWHPELGAWVAVDVAGPSAAILRLAGLTANTLGHTIVSLHPPSQRLLDHEVAHVRQFERLGLGMYPLYLWLSARHGYRQNPLEVAARRGAARRAAVRAGGISAVALKP